MAVAEHAPHPEQARHWRTLRRAAGIPLHLRPWLSDTGSLTRLLQRASQGRFSVRIKRQHWACPSASEAWALDMPSRQRALIREVELCGAGEPWVFARTVIPASTLSGRHRALRQLGARSLGSKLFSDPGMRREPLQIAQLRAAGGLWARRSLFYLDAKPLLVCEVFLPPMDGIHYPR